LNLPHIKNKNLLFHYVIVQNISVASKTKKKTEKREKEKNRYKRRLLVSAAEN
jgi:hypothetical protein